MYVHSEGVGGKVCGVGGCVKLGSRGAKTLSILWTSCVNDPSEVENNNEGGGGGGMKFFRDELGLMLDGLNVHNKEAPILGIFGDEIKYSDTQTYWVTI